MFGTSCFGYSGIATVGLRVQGLAVWNLGFGVGITYGFLTQRGKAGTQEPQTPNPQPLNILPAPWTGRPHEQFLIKHGNYH